MFTSEDGEEFATEKCSFRVSEGAVNSGEVIGVSITELVDDEEQLKVLDSRFMTDGLQCRIDAVSVDGEPLIDYRLLETGEICMPLPDMFRPEAVEALVGGITADATLNALGSKLYLVSSAGEVKVCGKISSLSATTTVALRAEVARELPPAPARTSEITEIETGASRLTMVQAMALLLIGVSAIVLAAVATRFSRRRIGRR